MKRVCIIGLGWLGEQVGDYLIQEEYSVAGTTTSQQKLASLKEKFNAVIELDINAKEGWSIALLSNYDYYVLTVPPSAAISNYSKRMSALVRHITTLNAKAKIIFTSSTSVYGSIDTEVDEGSDLNPQSQSAKEIVDFETYLQKYHSSKSIILRLGGLCGYNRHPARSLSTKKNIKKPRAVVNLVHAEDVCRLVHFLIKTEIGNGVFNVCSGAHPEKKEYYEWAASQLKITKPFFDKSDNLKDKTVICKAIWNFDFNLKYNSPYEYPELIDE